MANLSDEQVFALNRSLNNVVKSGLPMEYDMYLLEQVIENDYDSREINALTKAMEEEAKFQDPYEKTGNEKFLDRAQSQKEKFLATVGRFGVPEENEGSGDTEEQGLRAEVSVRTVAGAATKAMTRMRTRRVPSQEQ